MKTQHSSPQVIGIASGKGGVGKTTVSVNLAVALALRGRKVMLLDADLGMANAQISLGVKTPWNIGHVLRGEKTLKEVAVTTPQGVLLVPGVSGLREAAALDMAQIGAIVHAFDDLDDPIDYLIVDVAAGISPPVLAFMAACQRRLVTLYSVFLFHPMKWQSEEHIGIREAAEWSRHFAELEKEMDVLLCQLFGRAEPEITDWIRTHRYVTGREMVAAGLAELVPLAPLPTAPG